jgi:hypothetical protein
LQLAGEEDPSEPVEGRDGDYAQPIPCTEQPGGESSEDFDHRSSSSSSPPSNTFAQPMGFPLTQIDLNQTPTGYRQQTQASRNKAGRGQKRDEASNPRQQQQKKSNQAKSSRKTSHPASTTAINAMRRIAKKQQKQKLSVRRFGFLYDSVLIFASSSCMNSLVILALPLNNSLRR